MIKEKIDKILIDFAEEVNEAILKREFEIVGRDVRTIKIKCLGECVEIWNVENQGTHCYLINSERAYYYFPEVAFTNQDKCRKLLNEESKEENAKRLAEIDEQIKRLEALK